MNSNRSFKLCLLPTLCLALGPMANAGEPEDLIRFNVSGPVADKLPDDVTVAVTVWKDGKDHCYTSRVGEMPLVTSRQHFLRVEGTKTVPAPVIVSLESAKQGWITSVLLSENLFDAPRVIDVTLKRPETFVGPTVMFRHVGFRYHAMISRRMLYSDVPRWDAETKKFLPPVAPVLHLYRAATGELLQKSEMRSMCFPYGWEHAVDFPPELPDGTELHIVVTHDTGDLFGELKAECSYAYRKKGSRP